MRKVFKAFFFMSILLLAGGVFAILFPDVLYAFHQGGAGYCDGCHDLHSPLEAAGLGTEEGDAFAAGLYMLKGSDP
ncbi:MAG: hypothetical protein AB1499_13085, partial [Nitrospirota bacterium]